MTTATEVQFPTVLDANAKAAVLAEALPYIRRFWSKVVVVKYGGNAMGHGTSGGAIGGGSVGGARSAEEPPSNANGLTRFAQDVALMRSVGMRPVVVHGGGPQIGELMSRLGKVPEFRDGLRVTDAETLEIVRMVLVGKVNRDIVAAINVHGSLAVGLSGEDAGLLRATAHSPALGFVGEVESVNPTILERLLAQELIPVVASIGSDDEGQAYNINADSAAGAVAGAVGAEKLVYLTNVEGLRRDPVNPASLISTVSVGELEVMMAEGTIAGGMIPKATSCVRALRAGVGQAHILDGRVPHALLLEVFTREGVGTMVTP